MNQDSKHITVFEHETLRFDQGEKRITEDQFRALEAFHGDGVPYFKLVYHGVQFNEYVGVLQIGDTLIEILPKADKGDQDKTAWRERLVGMLKSVGLFDISAPSSGNLSLKSNSILDLYFELFVTEVEYLLHTGLIKKYRKIEANSTALKGSLLFAKHLTKNLVHKEKFFVRHTTYDVNHDIHRILNEALLLLSRLNKNSDLKSRIGQLLLNFPEQQSIRLNQATFDKIVYNRKNTRYRTALEIARLLLLQYHPDVAKGKNHLLALMFDMNLLWEKFVYVSLRKYGLDNFKVSPQTSKFFWKPYGGKRSTIRPDLHLKTATGNVVLDTKWKNIGGYNPSPDDLRQMYVYHDYYDADRVALIYPGKENSISKGAYLHTVNGSETDKLCSVMVIQAELQIRDWQMKIAEIVQGFVLESTLPRV